MLTLDTILNIKLYIKKKTTKIKIKPKIYLYKKHIICVFFFVVYCYFYLFFLCSFFLQSKKKPGLFYFVKKETKIHSKKNQVFFYFVKKEEKQENEKNNKKV